MLVSVGLLVLSAVQIRIFQQGSMSPRPSSGMQETIHHGSAVELSTNLREVPQCPEKSTSRVFSLLKVPTSATGLLDTTGRHEIGTLVRKDNNQ